MIGNWKKEPWQVLDALPKVVPFRHLTEMTLQDLAALPTPSGQEDDTVRQAIEEVLARVNLTPSKDLPQEEDQAGGMQQAAEPKDIGEYVQKQISSPMSYCPHTLPPFIDPRTNRSFHSCICEERAI